MTAASASSGCSPPKKLDTKWSAPIQTPPLAPTTPKSHNHSDAVLVFRLHQLVPTKALRAARPRSTLARMSLVVAVQVNGFG